jgi:hypothetical protein
MFDEDLHGLDMFGIEKILEHPFAMSRVIQGTIKASQLFIKSAIRIGYVAGSDGRPDVRDDLCRNMAAEVTDARNGGHRDEDHQRDTRP